MVKIDGFTLKYAFMDFIQQRAFLVFPEKSAGRAALTSAVLVVVDIGFTGVGTGLAGGGGNGAVGGGAVVTGGIKGRGLAGGAMVTRGLTGGNELVTGMVGWGFEGGRGVMCLDGKGKNAGLAVYQCPKYF